MQTSQYGTGKINRVDVHRPHVHSYSSTERLKRHVQKTPFSFLLAFVSKKFFLSRAFLIQKFQPGEVGILTALTDLSNVFNKNLSMPSTLQMPLAKYHFHPTVGVSWRQQKMLLEDISIITLLAARNTMSVIAVQAPIPPKAHSFMQNKVRSRGAIRHEELGCARWTILSRASTFSFKPRYSSSFRWLGNHWIPADTPPVYYGECYMGYCIPDKNGSWNCLCQQLAVKPTRKET